MKSGSSWSVRDIAPEARETAKAAAKREGMTVGAWLSRTILASRARGEPEADADLALRDGTSSSAGEELHIALATIADRLDAIARSLGGLAARLEGSEYTLPRGARASARGGLATAVAAVFFAAVFIALGAAAWNTFGDALRDLAAGVMERAEIVRATEEAAPPKRQAERRPAPAAAPAEAGNEETAATAEAVPADVEAAPEPAAADEAQTAPRTSGKLTGIEPGRGPTSEDLSPPDGVGPFAEPAPGKATQGIAAAIPDAGSIAAYRKAAEAGAPRAQYNLGVLYAEGRGVAADYQQAFAWFERAAKQGLANAQYNLAVMYERGTGVAADAAQARSWYERAAELDHPRAQHNLAVMYASGEQVTLDYATAARWFEKAAEHGLPQAQFNLALLYARGLGVPQDDVLAYKWLTVAEGQGDGEAAARKRALAARLSPEARSRAVALARAWKPLPAAVVSPPIAENAPQPAPLPGRSGAGRPDRAMVARVQTLLAELGFDPGPADGVAGSKTRQAIHAYQEALGLEADGRISPELLSHLERVTGAE